MAEKRSGEIVLACEIVLDEVCASDACAVSALYQGSGLLGRAVRTAWMTCAAYLLVDVDSLSACCAQLIERVLIKASR